MGKQKAIALLFCLLSTGLFAQDEQDSTFTRTGLVRVFGCFAFDYRPYQNVWDYRFHGFSEYYMTNKVSVLGEMYKYIDSNNEQPIIKSNSSLALGMAYHWPVKNLDPYVFGMGGGNFYTSRVTLPDSTVYEEEWDKPNTHLNPMVSIGGGFNLYVWKYLNIFIQVRYTRAFIYSSVQIVNMDSFSVSYGLGFNLHTKKRSN